MRVSNRSANKELMGSTSQVTYRLCGVVRHIGLPVANVSIVLCKGKREVVAQEKTNQRGEFTFAVEQGTYSLKVLPGDSTRFLPRSLDGIEVVNNTVCNLALETGFTLSGTVKAEEGIDLTHYSVKVVKIDAPGYEHSEFLYQDGRFSFILPRGKYYLVAYPDPARMGATIETHTTPSLATSTELIEINSDSKADISLRRLVRVNGWVANSSGAPLPGSRIAIAPTMFEDNEFLNDLSVGTRCLTNENGGFEFKLQPGRYDLLIQPPADSNLSEVVHAICVEEETAMPFVLSEGFHVQGTLLFQNQPLASCRISANRRGEAVETVTLTDESGKFSFRLPAGAYDIRVSSEAAQAAKPGHRISSACHTATIDGDCLLQVELKEGCTVSFDVVTEDDEPMPGCKITYGPYGQEGKAPADLPEHQAGCAESSAEGRCEFFMPSGVYYFQFVPEDKASYQTKTIRQLSIGSDTHRKVKLPRKKGEGQTEASSVTQLWIQGTDVL